MVAGPQQFLTRYTPIGWESTQYFSSQMISWSCMRRTPTRWKMSSSRGSTLKIWSHPCRIKSFRKFVWYASSRSWIRFPKSHTHTSYTTMHNRFRNLSLYDLQFKGKLMKKHLLFDSLLAVGRYRVWHINENTRRRKITRRTPLKW